MANNSWILKILSGTHVGAEVILSAKESILGKDESCDLVLSDVSLSGKHIGLRSDESGAYLRLLDIDKPIYIDGEKFTEENTILKPFQVITIGTLFLAVGPSDTQWPPIDLLLKNKIEPAQTPSKDTNQNGESDSATENETTTPPAVDANTPSNKSPMWIYLLAGGLPLGVIIIVLIIWSFPAADEKHLKLSTQQINQIQQLATQYDANIQIHKISEGRELSEIIGYVNTEANRIHLLERFSAIDIHAEIKITSSEKIMHAISAVIDKFLNRNENDRVEVVAVPGSPGEFILKGYIKDDKLWQQVMKTLKHDVKNYRRLQDNVQTQKDRISTLQQMLLEAGLQDQIKITEAEKGLILSGELGNEEREQLTHIKELFNQKFNSNPLVTWDIEGGKNEESSIKLDIRAISFGGNPHIVMRNGQRYAKGAQLDNGYTVDAITVNFIVLRKGKKTAYFYLNAAR